MPEITGSLMVLIGSFGFATIVPSLREYFQDDVKQLRKVILLGSFIPLICYILWIAVITGVVEKEGAQGLIALKYSGHSNTGLINALNSALHNSWVTWFFSFFSSICMVTAFLAVSLGLFDFLADGLKFNKRGIQGKCILGLTFLPPLAVVVINPGIYIKAFSYAGVCCVLLLLLLPTAMAWRARLQSASSDEKILVPGGQWLLGALGVVAVCLLWVAFRYP